MQWNEVGYSSSRYVGIGVLCTQPISFKWVKCERMHVVSRYSIGIAYRLLEVFRQVRQPSRGRESS